MKKILIILLAIPSILYSQDRVQLSSFDIMEINEAVRNCLEDYEKESKVTSRNEDYFYEYLEKVDKKEILVNEIRLIYVVQKGDYLGKIAREYELTVSNIKQWNKLHSDNLSIGDQLILYIPDEN